MPRTLRLNPREAAFVADRDVREVNRAVDAGVVERRVQTQAGRSRRVLGRREVRFLRVVLDAEGTLTREGRKRLYEAFSRVRGGKATVGPLVVDVQKLDADIERRVEELDQVRQAVEDVPGGDPVLRGTGVPVHLIAALVEGEGVEGTLGAYPSLTRAQVEAAEAYARVYPKRGRPYPKKSLKRLFSELALPDGVFEDDREESAGPRVIRL